MTTLREAAQQALEALEPMQNNRDDTAIQRAITALRAALAQSEPRNQCGETCERAKLCAVCARGLAQEEQEREPSVAQLNAILDGLEQTYVRESAREFLRVWIRDWTMHKVARALAQQEQEQESGGVCARCGGWVCDPVVAQPEQEPVAWSPSLTYPNYEKGRVWLNGKPRQEDVEYWSKNGNGITYVYTAPPRQWRGLKEWEINDGRDQLPTEDLCGWSFRQGAYFAETKLKEKNA
jgi:hypothetical protein